MRDEMKPGSRSLLSSLVSPAEGIEPESGLFSESPIEALDWLRELGAIAHASIEPPAVDESLGEALGPVAPEAPSESAPSEAKPAASAAAPKSEDSRLIEALLEYHRLRNPAIRAKQPRASDAAEPAPGFAPLEIPIVDEVLPRGSFLRPKDRP